MPLRLWQEVQILPWSTEIVALTCGTRLRPVVPAQARQACCATPVQNQKVGQLPPSLNFNFLTLRVWYRSRRRCLMPALCRLRFCRATSSYLPKMVFISAVSAIARAPDEGWLDDFEKIAAAAGSRSRPFKTDLSRSSIFLLSGYPYTSCNCLAISAAVSRS
jgi:hypothetical protein